MAWSRRIVLASSTVAGGTALLVALGMSPAGAAGGAAAAVVPPGGCSATAHVDNKWGSGSAGGEIVTVTVTNTSAVTTKKWTATWTLATGQQVVSAWNAVVSTADGTATAVNAGYNAVLPPGAWTTFGMQVSGTGPAPVLSCDNGATPPTSPPPGGADVTVTETDNQSTVTLFVGESLGVSLGAQFRPPAAAGAALAQISTSGGYPSGQPLAALYRAAAVGSADLTTTTDNACLHLPTPCSIPVMLWKVHVNVVDGAGSTVTVSAADNRSTVRLHTGDTLAVTLVKDFVPPKLSGAGVLVQRDVTGGFPTGQPLVARYIAVAAGEVDVSTYTDDACNHAPLPCPSPPVPWTVHVVVTA